MVHRSTPQLGPGLEDVINEGDVWFDIPGQGTIISPRLGNPEWGTDGRKYILVKAGAALAATASPGLEVSVDETTWVATGGGAGGFFTKPDTAIPNGAYFWARKETL